MHHTKAEFDAALSDFNARLTTFEAGINSKIDSQVSSYLDRNGIWNATMLEWADSTLTKENAKINCWFGIRPNSYTALNGTYDYDLNYATEVYYNIADGESTLTPKYRYDLHKYIKLRNFKTMNYTHLFRDENPTSTDLKRTLTLLDTKQGAYETVKRCEFWKAFTKSGLLFVDYDYETSYGCNSLLYSLIEMADDDPGLLNTWKENTDGYKMVYLNKSNKTLAAGGFFNAGSVIWNTSNFFGNNYWDWGPQASRQLQSQMALLAGSGVADYSANGGIGWSVSSNPTSYFDETHTGWNPSFDHNSNPLALIDTNGKFVVAPGCFQHKRISVFVSKGDRLLLSNDLFPSAERSTWSSSQLTSTNFQGCVVTRVRTSEPSNKSQKWITNLEDGGIDHPIYRYFGWGGNVKIVNFEAKIY